jgi:AcrR family transcriptional regulator
MNPPAAVEPEPERLERLGSGASRAVRRQRVVEAAVELASEGGYDTVQMRDVAARAGVALGTIYRYFPSKDQLLAAAQVAWARQLQERLGRRPPAGDDPLARLLDVIGRACRAIERNQQLSSALVTAIASPDPGVHPYQAEMNRIVTDMFSQALDGLDRERQAGVVRVLSNVWFAALIGWVHGWRQVRTIGDEMAFAADVLLGPQAPVV